MSEHIVETFGIVQEFADLHGDMNTPLYEAIMDVMLSRQREEIVRCRDCTFAYRVFWPESCDVPEDFRNCHGPLVAHWDYEQDEPAKNPVEPDGFCKWGERRNNEQGEQG